MMRQSPIDLRAYRMQAQRLSPPSALADAGSLLREVVAIQAQEAPSASLSIRPRTANLRAEDARIAREETRSIVLTWCMRGTMHLLPAADVVWLMDLFGPVFLQKTKSRYNQLGLYDAARARAMEVIADMLGKRGAVTRPEMRDLMARRGLPTEGQAFIHLMRAAALKGLICFGPDMDGEQSFVLLADWITSENAPDDPAAELARRYLNAYGPASPADLARWSGLSLKIARAGFEAIADELIEFEDSSLWMLKDTPQPDASSIVRLLPAYDTFLLGYDSRAFMISSENESKIHPGGGIIKPSILVDGRIVGTWRVQKTVIHIEAFEPLSDDAIAGIESEARDIGRYLGVNTTLTIGGKMRR